MAVTLYDRVTELHGHRPWGAVLDAGTGPGSIRWLQALDSASWAAVTGSPGMAKTTEAAMVSDMRQDDRLIVGNWTNPDLLKGERFDVVLADYLLGAIEGFAPYWQDQLFARLRPMVGKRLYVIGLQPYVLSRSETPAGQMVSEIGRLRDACLLLAGDSPYREYPMDWTIRSLEAASFKVIDAHLIPIRFGERFVDTQLAMCCRATDKWGDRRLAVSMLQHVAQVRTRALSLVKQLDGLAHGEDYILVAEPA